RGRAARTARKRGAHRRLLRRVRGPAGGERTAAAPPQHAGYAAYRGQHRGDAPDPGAGRRPRPDPERLCRPGAVLRDVARRRRELRYRNDAMISFSSRMLLSALVVALAPAVASAQSWP